MVLLKLYDTEFWKKIIVCVSGKRLTIMKYLILMALLTIKLSKEVEILGIKIDNNLNVNKHIKSICRKAGKTLIALSRKSSNFNIRRKKHYLYQWQNLSLITILLSGCSAQDNPTI